MKQDIDATITVLEDATKRIAALIQCSRNYDCEEATWARVDLGQASHDLKRALDSVRRLTVNGAQPWDNG